ncbi:MAG TPA: ChaN family lipoprotein [Candidatus Sulfotelmatobacter sp.]|nr:ChaN family lipoprotein [Candidatus Sulfotelmatobacter sp.]
MRSSFSIRARRRTAAQQLALLQVQREISATDPHGRLKYVRDFSEAFRDYRRTLAPAEFKQCCSNADVLLLGDYHALAASQEFAASLLGQLAQARPVVLALEMVFSRDQYVLDEWLRGEITDEELRTGLRYEDEWGYDWEPFLLLLRQARKHGCPIYGIDLKPRGNMRRIGARDRHAATQIAQIRRAHPEEQVLTFFGEAHLAPNHLPQWLRLLRPQDRMLTVLQNVDELYWKSAGELNDSVNTVQVADDVLCVFNATPLEKYESYRIYIGKWRTAPSQPDLAPTFYNLVDTFLHSMGLEQYSPAAGSHASALVEDYPEVHARAGAREFDRLLAKKAVPAAERRLVLEKLRRQGCVYSSKHNLLLIKRFQLSNAAEEAVRFVQSECRGAACSNGPWPGTSHQDQFYFDVIDHAFITFGARVLLPHYPVLRRSDFGTLNAPAQMSVARHAPLGDRERKEMIEFLVLHKESEGHARLRADLPRVIATGIASSGQKREFLVRNLGSMLGAEMHEAYLTGALSKSYLRALFFRKVHLPGVAKKTYFELARKVNPDQGKLFN